MNPFGKSARSFSIFPISTETLNDCARIYAAGFAHAWGDGELRTLLDGAGMRGLVLRANSGNKQVSAFVLYTIADKEAEIITLACDPLHRRKGYGRAVMDEVIRNCLGERVEELFLEVAENNLAAIGLYKAIGFNKVGERQAYYKPGNNEGGENALVMRLDLKN